jgi:hypothetical protein
MRAILYKNGNKASERDFPSDEIKKISDLEKGLEWQILEVAEIPTIDPKRQKINVIETKTDDVYLDFKVTKRTFEVVNLSKEEIQSTIIANAETNRKEAIREKIENQIVSEAQTGTDS